MPMRPPPGDTDLILKEAAKRLDLPTRRIFLRQALGLGTLAMLTGCDISDGISAERALDAMSDFNDRVQAWLFKPTRLAREFPASAITRPFPFNAFYPRGRSPIVEADDFALEVSGRVTDNAPWTLERLYALPRVTQITRHICIEGWSAIGQWSGVRFSHFLALVGADLRSRYVTFRCEDHYVTSIDMPTALHPQTQLTFWFGDAVLPRDYGFPMKLRVPTKLGFKNPKHVIAVEVGNDFTGGHWETYGYNWFSGL